MIAKTFRFYKLKEKEIWDIWNKHYDEQHIWGDLTREEEIRLENILKGKDDISI